MIIPDRVEAGRQLGEQLARFRGTNPAVLGIPRGGVIVASEIARALGGTLDIVITRKIPSPANSEVAIGAVAPDGSIILDPQLSSFAAETGNVPGIPKQYLEESVERCLQEIERRRAAYVDRPFPELTDRVTILVDDGIATGFSMLAALRWLNGKAPGRLVLAVPVAPQDVLEELAPWCDEILVLLQPEGFHSVGQFYGDFTQTSEQEVRRALSRSV